MRLRRLYRLRRDRKSTRLNSSHANISYAVFCLKKKKIPIYDFHAHEVEYNFISDMPLLVSEADIDLVLFCLRDFGDARAHAVIEAVFFFNDTATTEIYTLSLHDALPISSSSKKTAIKQISAATAVQALARM